MSLNFSFYPAPNSCVLDNHRPTRLGLLSTCRLSRFKSITGMPSDGVNDAPTLKKEHFSEPPLSLH